VKAVVSTGALMAHGLVEAAGRSHFKYDPKMDDLELYEAGYNRVYDTLEPETNLDFVETIVARILKAWDHNEVLCSYKLNREIGRYLSQHVEDRGILKSAFEKNVPVFVPAFSDSEIGLDVALHNRARRKNDMPPLHYDPTRTLCCNKSAWASSPLAAACPEIGRNNLAHSSSCAIAGAGKTCR